jgi:hypothetical protein
MTTIRTASGRTRVLPSYVDPATAAGLDEEGRLVVDNFSARTSTIEHHPGGTVRPFLFGLTLCCNASDKGCEDGVFCRACYGSKPNADTGHYLFMADDGTFPGLDPVASVR